MVRRRSSSPVIFRPPAGLACRRHVPREPDFLTRNAGKWVREMQTYVDSQHRELQTLYFFYTTCPKCAKHYGKNYVVAFAKV
ncbi:MAG: hydrolase [Pirellulaceae bacterium]